jgi:hypothetical protein
MQLPGLSHEGFAGDGARSSHDHAKHEGSQL